MNSTQTAWVAAIFLAVIGGTAKAVFPEDSLIWGTAFWICIPALVWTLDGMFNKWRVTASAWSGLKSAQFNWPITFNARTVQNIGKRRGGDDLEALLFHGCIWPAFNTLEKDLFFTVALLCFNGSREPLKVTDVSGHIEFRPDTSKPEAERKNLPMPSLRDRVAAASIKPRSEFLIVLEQRVPREVAQEILASLEAKKRIGFNMENLLVMVAPAGGQPVRLPTWGDWTADRNFEAIYRTTVVRPTSIVMNIN